MGKAKQFFSCVLITFILWILARFIPALIFIIFPGMAELSLWGTLLLLLAAWAIANGFSKGRYSGCIRTNLYIFIVLEGFSILGTTADLISILGYTSGTYTASYISQYVTSLIVQMLYVGICFFLRKATTETDFPIDIPTSNEQPELPQFEQMTFSLDSESSVKTVPSKQRFRWSIVIHLCVYTAFLVAIAILLYQNFTLRSECNRLSAELPTNWQLGYDAGYTDGEDDAFVSAYVEGFSEAEKLCTNYIRGFATKKQIPNFSRAYQDKLDSELREAYTDGYQDAINGTADYARMSLDFLSKILH